MEMPPLIVPAAVPPSGVARDIYVAHCEAVAREAVEICRREGLPLDEADVAKAAMLHDIGIFGCDAPGIGCHGTAPYICHGPLGADLLRLEGEDEKFARVAERHTGSGLTAAEIEAEGLPLPPGRSYLPETLLEKLICYADKFYSKTPGRLTERKPLEKVRAQMARFGPGASERFEALHSLFNQAK